MKSKSSEGAGQGRPSATAISPDLLDAIRTYPYYSRSPFEETDPSKYKEADLRVVVSLISQKIRDYAVRYARKREFTDLIEPKLGDSFHDYLSGNYYEELLDAKTLKRCFVERQASETTQNILKAFKMVYKDEAEQKKKFERVEGLYYAITTHSTLPGTFQLTLMKIGDDTTMIKHISSRLELETKMMSQEMIGKNNLLLTLKESNHALFFYLYIGTDNQPPFIQGAILYSNLYGNVISNLAVFARIKKMTVNEEKAFIENFSPGRGLKEIPEDIAEYLANGPEVVEKDASLTVLKNMQYFLLQKARPLSTKVYNNLLPFDFAKSIAAEPGPYGQEAHDYSKAKALAGKYYIYFSERYKSAKGIKDELFDKSEEFSTVGKGIFEIYRDQKSGAMKCIMITRKDTEGNRLTHEGFIINTRLGVSPYLLTSLYSGQDDERCIVLLFKIIDDNKMTGGHVIAYSVPGRLGAGAVVMVRQEVIDGQRDDKTPREEPLPQALIPHSPEIKHVLEKRILNYLSQKNRGLVEPPEEYEALETKGADNPYEGLYRLYEAKDDGQGFAVSVLRIYRESFVTHIDARGDRATGIVAKVDDFLSVTLKNEVTKRTGFLCIKVGAEPTPPITGMTIYQGTFAGVSRATAKDLRGPVASQFFIEFCGKTESPEVKPEELVSASALPSEIRKYFATTKITKLSFAGKSAQS